jgi:hypothetical protein
LSQEQRCPLDIGHTETASTAILPAAIKYFPKYFSWNSPYRGEGAFQGRQHLQASSFLRVQFGENERYFQNGVIQMCELLLTEIDQALDLPGLLICWGVVTVQQSRKTRVHAVPGVVRENRRKKEV